MMEPTAAPTIGITITYWLHMLATVTWIGGMAAVSLLVLPAARKVLEPASFAALLSRLQTRLQLVGWFSLAVLTVTGLFQMSASPFYEGFLAIRNPWAMAILFKHLVIGLMVLVSVYVTWGLLPALQRTLLLRAAGRPIDEAREASLQRREIWLLRLNLLLSVIVLALTALARTAK
jgi:uncharacterized membrane protein